MKTAETYSLELEQVAEVRRLADELGISRSQFAAMVLRVGLARSREMWGAVTAWAERTRAEKQIQERLLPSEQQALAMLEGNQWHEIRFPGKVLFRALLGLKAKGMAECQDYSGKVKNASGNPIRSQWRRKAPTGG